MQSQFLWMPALLGTIHASRQVHTCAALRDGPLDGMDDQCGHDAIGTPAGVITGIIEIELTLAQEANAARYDVTLDAKLKNAHFATLCRCFYIIAEEAATFFITKYVRMHNAVVDTGAQLVQTEKSFQCRPKLIRLLNHLKGMFMLIASQCIKTFADGFFHVARQAAFEGFPVCRQWQVTDHPCSCRTCSARR